MRGADDAVGVQRDRPRRPHPVATTSEIPPGGRKIVEIDGRSIGVFNVGGSFYALRNLCPHQGAPLCEGPVMGTTLPSRPGTYVLAREGEILRCPWHGWEFDLRTGRSLADPDRARVRSFPVTTVAAGPAAWPEAGSDAEDAGAAPRCEATVEGVERYPVTVAGSVVLVHV